MTISGRKSIDIGGLFPLMPVHITLLWNVGMSFSMFGHKKEYGSKIARVKTMTEQPDKKTVTTSEGDGKEKNRLRRVLRLLMVLVVVGLLALLFVPATSYIPGYGNVLSAQDAVLRAGSKGAIETIHAKSGDRVANGDIVLELESEVERAEVERCRHQLTESQAELEYLLRLNENEQEHDRLELEFATVKRADAETEFRRVEKLQTQSAASNREFQSAKAAFELTDAEYKRLAIDRNPLRQATLAVQNRKIATLEAQLARAQSTLDRRKVRAPLTGVIVLHGVSLGQVIDANEVLGQIFDDHYHQVVARMPERFAPFLKSGQDVDVEISAYPKSKFGCFKGKIYWVSPVVTPHESGDGTILIRVKLDNVPSNVDLKAGMAAQIWVHGGNTRLLWKLVGKKTYDDNLQQER